VTIRLAGDATIGADLSAYGDVVQRTSATAQFKVKRDRVIAVCKTLLDQLPVADIDIQEVPIEDVIGQIFARRPVADQNLFFR